MVQKGKYEMLEIREINTVKGFFELRSLWNEVLERSKDNSALLTWEQISVSVKNLTKNQLLKILLITNGDKIVAIAPLRQSIYDFKGLFRYSIIEPLDYGSATDYTGLILAEKETECLQTILEYLLSQDDWDFIQINDIPATSMVVNLLIKKRHLFPKFELKEGAICPFITIPDSMEYYLKNLSRNFRRNLLRCIRNLEKDHGKVELKEYYELGSLENTMELFFNLHQKRWALKGGTGAFSSQKIRDIFMDRAKLFAEKDWFGLYFLTVNNKPVAAKYTLKYNRKLHGCLSGFDPAFSSYSVGNLVLMKLLEKCIKQGIKEYDFMKGDESHKSKWTNRFRRNVNLEFVSGRTRSQLIGVGIETKERVLNSFLRKFI
jgi:hypothetical protein